MPTTAGKKCVGRRFEVLAKTQTPASGKTRQKPSMGWETESQGKGNRERKKKRKTVIYLPKGFRDL